MWFFFHMTIQLSKFLKCFLPASNWEVTWLSTKRGIKNKIFSVTWRLPPPCKWSYSQSHKSCFSFHPHISFLRIYKLSLNFENRVDFTLKTSSVCFLNSLIIQLFNRIFVSRLLYFQGLSIFLDSQTHNFRYGLLG